MTKDSAQSGFIKAGIVALVFIGIMIGIAAFKNRLADPQPSLSPTLPPGVEAGTPAVTVLDKLPKSPQPSTTSVKTSIPSPTSQPSAQASTAAPSSNATVYVDTSCASGHDGLGKHMDATITFKNLEKLDSKDLAISVIDTVTQHRLESHVKTDLVDNISIPFHKYVYAFQGFTEPLELVPDGRDYTVRIIKANYKSDGTIDVYVQGLETKFSKKCDI